MVYFMKPVLVVDEGIFLKRDRFIGKAKMAKEVSNKHEKILAQYSQMSFIYKNQSSRLWLEVQETHNCNGFML